MKIEAYCPVCTLNIPIPEDAKPGDKVECPN
jgi:hypothetical protein